MQNYDPSQLSEAVIQMMTDVVLILKTYGIEPIPAGNVMRLLGVPEDEAQKWDTVMLTLSDHGELILNKDSEEESEGQEIPPTLH
jgi:hypothetical protein